MPAECAEPGLQAALSGTPGCRQQIALPVAFFFYLGTSSLLGWNTILAFTHTFDCNVFNGKLWAGSGWPFWSAITYSLSVNIAQGALVARTVNENWSNRSRIHVGTIGSAIGALGLLLCSLYIGPDSEDSGLAAALLSVAVVGCSAAAFQSAAFGMAGAISPRLMQALMVGQGFAGVMTGVMTLLVGGSSSGLKVSFLAACAWIMIGSPLLCYYGKYNGHLTSLLQVRETPAARSDAGRAPAQSQSFQLNACTDGSARSTQFAAAQRSSLAILLQTAWPQALTVWFVFAATFIVFPGVASRWQPSENVNTLIAIFQFLDVVGRMSVEAPVMKITNGRTISLLALARVLFVPVFILLQRLQTDLTRSIGLQDFLMVAFSWSNGYIATLSMMKGPDQEGLAEDEREPVGTIMSLCLCSGILTGSIMALPTQIGVTAPPSCAGSR